MCQCAHCGYVGLSISIPSDMEMKNVVLDMSFEFSLKLEENQMLLSNTMSSAKNNN